MDSLNLGTLNHDVLFLHSSPKDLSSLLQVNRTFNLIISNNIFWKEKAIFDGFFLIVIVIISPMGYQEETIKYLIFYRCGSYHCGIGSILAASAKEGHKDIVKMMLEKGATNYDCPMEWAAIGGHKEIIELMLDKGATDYDGAMRWASSRGHKEIVERMLDLGATDYSRAIGKASEGGYGEIIDLIQKWKDKKI